MRLAFAFIGVLSTLTRFASADILEPTLLGEVDYRAYPSEVEGTTGFALARLRPGLALTPAPWMRANVTIEFAGENPIILDAFARFRASRWAEFTVGYSKPPLFASFTHEPVQVLPFPDRAPVVTSFRIRRDLGADVHLRPREIPVEAWLRVGNGSGSLLGNDNALPAGYGALDWVAGRAWTGSAARDREWGGRIGASLLVEDVRDRDGISGQTPLGFVYFRPVVVSGLRAVGEAHIVGYWGPLRWTTEGALARESRSRDDDGNPSTPRAELGTMHSYGLTSELAWVVGGRAREVGRPPRGDDEEALFSLGALEVAARYDGMWLGRDAVGVRLGGSQGGAVSIKWWPSKFLSVTTAGYWTHYDAPPLEEPNVHGSWGWLTRLSFFWGQPGEAL